MHYLGSLDFVQVWIQRFHITTNNYQFCLKILDVLSKMKMAEDNVQSIENFRKSVSDNIEENTALNSSDLVVELTC